VGKRDVEGVGMDVARLEWWMIALEAPTILIGARERSSFCWPADVRWLVVTLPSTFTFEIRVRGPAVGKTDFRQ
jgi:hypothetical protein